MSSIPEDYLPSAGVLRKQSPITASLIVAACTGIFFYLVDQHFPQTTLLEAFACRGLVGGFMMLFVTIMW
jgi:hypothetical protein